MSPVKSSLDSLRRRDESQTFTKTIEKIEVVRRPEHKISLISLESLREDLPLNKFIEQCRPLIANLGSNISDQMFLQDVPLKQIHHQPQTATKIKEEFTMDLQYESEPVRMFADGETQFDITDNDRVSDEDQHRSSDLTN